jgi:HipA-like protein
MNRKANVYFNRILAGTIEETGDRGQKKYIYTYDHEYLADPKAPPVSLTLPKRKEPYLSETLFPFFYGLLSEGRMKEIQCRILRIDENDCFGRLINTLEEDCIGPVTIRNDVELPVSGKSDVELPVSGKSDTSKEE